MEYNMSFKEAIELTHNIITRFEKIERKLWNVEGSVIELQKQVGELAKLVMMKEGYYFSDRDVIDEQYKANTEKISDELADIFYATIRIAKEYDIDLIDAHIKARKAEDNFLKLKGV